jgi:hypothetical protein
MESPSLRNVLENLPCSCCSGKACIIPAFNQIQFICIGHLCGCNSSGGSPICYSCHQRQKQIQKSQWGVGTWIVCKVCQCYIKWSSKEYFAKGNVTELLDGLITQARFRFAFPQGCGSIQANGSLTAFFPTFKVLGRDKYAYERFAIVISAHFAQSSKPRFLPFPQEGFFSKRIHLRMGCLSMTRKLFFKLIGISCDSDMFKLGYSVRKFSYVHNNYGNFLKMILKRILARFYLLP